MHSSSHMAFPQIISTPSSCIGMIWTKGVFSQDSFKEHINQFETQSRMLCVDAGEILR